MPLKPPAGPIRRIAVVNFTGIRANWGCQATSWELLKFVNSLFPTLPEVALIPLLPRHDIDRRLQAQTAAIYEAIRRVAAGELGSGEHLDYLERLCVARYGPLADAVRQSDAVFFQAEGTMTGTDVVRGARLILLPFVAKHAWSKPVYSLNQTLFSLDAALTGAMAAAYGTFDLVAVRESISHDFARKAGIRECCLIPDAAFLTRPTEDGRLPQLAERDLFAVTGSAFHAPTIYQDLIDAADAIRRHTGLTPLVMASTDADRKLMDLAAERWGPGAYEVVPPQVPYTSAARALKDCRFLFGGRYHMAILAASVGVSTVQVPGNSYKNEGLSALLDGLMPVRETGSIEDILRDVDDILDGHASHERLDSALRPVRASLEAARGWLSDHFAGTEREIPATLRQPPGRTIDAAGHLDRYRTSTLEQAAAFSYPATPGPGLGALPTAAAALPLLMPSIRAGDTLAAATAEQLKRSYPTV